MWLWSECCENVGMWGRSQYSWNKLNAVTMCTHDFSTGGLAVQLIQLTSQDPGSVRVLVSKLWEVTEEGTRHWPPASMRAGTHNAWKRTHRALALPFDNYCWYRCHTKHQFCHCDRVDTVFRVFFPQCNHELKAFNVFYNIVSNQSVPQPH